MPDEVGDFFNKQQLVALGLYLYEVVLKELLTSKGRHDAFEVLVDSIRTILCNESA